MRIGQKILAAAGATLFFVARAPAQPKAPPLERYTCHQIFVSHLGASYTYMGSLVLLPKNRYAWGYDKAKPSGRGRYSFGAKGIRFLDGPLKGIAGKFSTEKDGRHSFDLRVPIKKDGKNDDVTWYGNCDPHDPYEKKR